MVNTTKLLKPALLTLVIGLLLVQPMSIGAITTAEAKQLWYDAKAASRTAQDVYRKTNIDYAADKTEANNQKVIDSGKAVLQAALNEVEAWLKWVDLDVAENPEVTPNLKATIHQDVVANLAKIGVLRGDVKEVQNRIQLVTVFLKIVGKYFELVSDVAKNTGLVWVNLADTYVVKIEEYEAELRLNSKGATKESEIVAKLDEAKKTLATAKTNIDSAESEYLQVKIPGNPILRFSNGNQHIRLARNNLISAHASLKQAYKLLMETP